MNPLLPLLFLVASIGSPCFDATDATDCLQAALDSNITTGITVHLSADNGPWVVRPLWIRRSNLIVSLAPGVVLLAKPGAFRGTGDVLLSISGASNVTILGQPASPAGWDPAAPWMATEMPTLRMQQADYMNASRYTRAEWRHGVAIANRFGDGSEPPFALADRGCSGVTVSGVRIESTGGDGIYVR
jgi:hypothetical protein